MAYKHEVIQLTEWVDLIGKIHIHYDELVGTGANWIAPARVLGMNIVDFLIMLKKEYQADLRMYRGADGQVRFVGYTWPAARLVYARKFKNYVNKVARDKGVRKENIV